MPAAVIDLFSLSEMRGEFRVQDVVNVARDAVIQEKFAAATAWIARESGVPVLNETRTAYLPIPRDKTCPLLLDDTYVSAVTQVQYWTADGHLYEDPNGTVTAGRLQAHALDKAFLWPGATGWPQDALAQSDLAVTYTRGVSTVDNGLKGAIVILAYDLYLGAPEIRPTAAVWALIGPSRVYK